MNKTVSVNKNLTTITHFLVAFLSLCIIYRVTFLVNLYHSPIIRFEPAWAFLALGFLDDLCCAFLLGLICYVLQWSFSFLLRHHLKLKIFFRYLALVLLVILLSLLAFDFAANIKLFLTLYTGSSYSLLVSSLQQGFTPNKYLAFISAQDWVFISAPATIFLVFQLKATSQVSVYVLRTLLVCLLLSVLAGLYSVVRLHFLSYYTIIYQNPLTYAITDLVNPETNYYSTNFDKPSAAQMKSLKFIDPAFIQKETINELSLLQHKPKKWNVVLIVLESVGRPYVFDDSYAKATPMPFLKQLSQKGLWLDNNYSSGNTSLLGLFSLLTGDYPSPFPDNFEMQAKIKIPTIASWMKQYDSLFLMADDINYFFQPALVKNTGFKKIYDYFDIVAKDKIAGIKPGMNEIDAVNYFLARIKQAKTPFLAVYWSNATHHPYPDYGKPYRLRQDVEISETRYYNNMHLIDMQIKKIYAYLAAKKLLDDTIIVIVGDHGEGFGKHPDGWFHGRTVYQEQIKIPVLFYQSHLFKPQVFQHITSMTDIMPTLLDAVGVAYNANLIQGNSLLRKHDKRKYIFVYGNENELVSIDNQNVKLQVFFENGLCRRYDLNKDANELAPLACFHDDQEKALLQYRNYQPLILNKLHQAVSSSCNADNYFSCLFRQHSFN
jgi:membrane-anchored protein YejM (alkaline phosphatase superfamily)